MKELSIEQKAQRYNEAIVRANELLYVSDKESLQRKTIESIFPELKESEDEKIRQFLIHEVTETSDKIMSYRNMNKKDILAWLEKQGEQKSIDNLTQQEAMDIAVAKCFNEQKYDDKVKSKFKDGDLIVYKDVVWKICNISLQNYYELLKINNEVSTRLIKDVDKNAHLWTIQDAKVGDVLSDGTTIFIFEDLLSDCSVMSYCDYDTDSGEIDAFCPLSMNLMCSKITPATKEQRDTLMKAMAYAGFEFDFEKKELKRIEDEMDFPFSYYIPKGFHAEIDDDKVVIKKGEKPAEWSEEDEKNALHIKCLIGSYRAGDDECRLDSWIDSLKNRVQPKQDLSEKDERES